LPYTAKLLEEISLKDSIFICSFRQNGVELDSYAQKWKLQNPGFEDASNYYSAEIEQTTWLTLLSLIIYELRKI